MEDNCLTTLCWFLPTSTRISPGQPCVPSLLSLPLTSHPIPPLQVSQSIRFELPASQGKFPLAICFTHGHVYVSVLLPQCVPPSPSPTVSTIIVLVLLTVLLLGAASPQRGTFWQWYSAELSALSLIREMLIRLLCASVASPMSSFKVILLTTEPVLQSPCATAEACDPRVGAPQQEKPEHQKLESSSLPSPFFKWRKPPEA